MPEQPKKHNRILENKQFGFITMLEEKAKENGKKFWFSVGAIFLAVVMMGSFCLLQMFASMNTITGNRAIAMASNDIVYIRIEPGMTADNVSDVLQENEVISSKFWFWFLGKLNAADSKLKVGTYKLERNMAARDVLEILLSGKTSVQTFTIPEGFTINEIARRLEKDGVASAAEIKEAAKKYAPFAYIRKDDPRVIYLAEGFLFPDTYEVEPGASAEDILEIMTRNFDEQLTDEMKQKAKQRGLSVYELITMASLVEKEAMFEEDRAIISQVLLKRLEISMPLQSDASLQYLMDAPKEDVSIDDTKIDSPYNTYQHYGLPPGPIANPGLASINAVLNPAKTDYLYFVADRQGHNHYSKTYEDHLALVAQVR